MMTGKDRARERSEPLDGPIRVAVLGGGIGALIAAYCLSDPALGGRYQVTVHQQGWRLGGKCATGRGECDRIEEHGLHMLMGFYHETFRILRAVFDEWKPTAPSGHPFEEFSDAYAPLRRMTVMENLGTDDAPRWVPWSISFPDRPGLPGVESVARPDPLPSEPRDFVSVLLRFADDQYKSLPAILRESLDAGAPADPFVPAQPGAPDGELASPWLRKANDLFEGLPVDAPPAAYQRVADVLDGLLDRAALVPLFPHLQGDATRRALWLLQFAGAVTRGILWDIPDGDFDDLNDLEIRQWLDKHRLPAKLLTWVPVHLMYDLGFAYKDGDTSTPKNGCAAAGVTLRVMLRSALAYRDAPLYRMTAGMGDTVFTQLYRVLEARKVTVKFFHRVKKLELTADRQNIGQILVEEQVRLKPWAEAKGYRPIEPGDDLIERWPAGPDWSQIQDGPIEHQFEEPIPSPFARDIPLELGTDFHQVVLGIPVGALPEITRELDQHFPDWSRMLAEVPTVKTQAAQLWLARDTEQEVELFCTYAPAFGTASAMSELIEREGWPKDRPPRALQYLVSALPDDDQQLAGPSDDSRAKTHLRLWLEREAPRIWRGLAKSGSFDFTALYHPDPAATVEMRFAFQMVRANSNGSSRYVQSFPRTIESRLPGRLKGVANLALAGDWVRTELSVGCVESAVQGGILAARVVRASTGDPP